MKAVRLHGKGDLRVESVPRPGPLQAGDVRIAVSAAGICGSDIHNFRTGQWITRAPSIAGHEFAGRVTEVGEDVTSFREGDAVAADSRVWCGTCPACATGQRHLCNKLGFVSELCDGGFAAEVVLPQRLLHKLPDGLSMHVAATAEPFAVALHAVRRLRLSKGEPVFILGCGPIGGFCAVVLAHLGFGPVYVDDRNPARVAAVTAATGAQAAHLSADGIRLPDGERAIAAAIDATGNVAALKDLLATLPGGGRVALVGISHGTLDLDPNILVERELALLGCHAFSDELPEAIAMLPACAAMIEPLLGPGISLDDVPAAYAAMIAGKVDHLKTVIHIAPGIAT
ncbi:MAG: alcohol dehydrogenase catalytic domain-containing protein [Hyphomicrobiales bacterium]